MKKKKPLCLGLIGIGLILLCACSQTEKMEKIIDKAAESEGLIRTPFTLSPGGSIENTSLRYLEFRGEDKVAFLENNGEIYAIPAEMPSIIELLQNEPIVYGDVTIQAWHSGFPQSLYIEYQGKRYELEIQWVNPETGDATVRLTGW